MDDSENEYEFALEGSDPHEDYEGIPDEDFDDVPDDEDDEMDDDDEEDHALAIANFAGVVGELRVFSSYDFNRHLNGFRLARIENRPPPSDDHFFRDMFQETIENIQRANSRIREQIRSMRRGHLIRTVEPLLLSTRVRPSSRDHLSLHPALHRPCLPAPEPERPATVIRTLVNLQNVSNTVHPQASNSQSELLDRINSQSLSTLHEVDLARSVNANSHVDILSNLSRNRPFERLSQRERDREKVPSSLARRWCYEPQSTGGDFLPIIFDGDSAPRRPTRTLPRQPIVANETHESAAELANTITERIDNLMTDIFKADDEVEKLRKKLEEQKKEEEKQKIEEAKKAKKKEEEEKQSKQDESSKSDKSKENMDITSEPGEGAAGQAAAVPVTTELNESTTPSVPSLPVSARVAPAPNRTEAQRTAPGLANAQEEATRPDLVMDSVEVAQRRNEEQRDTPTQQPRQESAAEEPENPQESASTDFAAVAARRAAAAGISLDAPANNNPEVVAAATESTGIDPAFLAALPEEMRTEILTQYYERICTNNEAQAGQATEQNTTAVNQDFLMALPPELRAEVLQLDAEFQSRQEAANGTGSRNEGTGNNENNNGAMAAADMDNATFLATLAPELREEILLESGEAFLRSLPPNMAAEARILRERDMSSRLPWRVNGQDLSAMGFDRRAFHGRLRDGPLGGRRGGRNHPREPPIFHWKKIENTFLREGPNTAYEPSETLQKNGLSSLIQLLWLKHGQYGKNLVYQVLSHACKTTESRYLVLDLLIALVTSSQAEVGSSSSSGGTNAAIDRSRRHGVAIRRGLELLILLCKNDSVVAETLLGLPRSKEELEKYESVSLSDSGESEGPNAPKISVSTLISLLSGSLFMRSNSHLEQLVSLISNVCQSIPPRHYNPSDKRRARRSRRTNRAIAPISGQMGDDHMNFFVVEHDDEENSMYDAQDDEAVDDEDSEDDIFRSIRRLREAGTSTLRETNGEGDNASGGEGSKAGDKEPEKDIAIPDRYRIPKLRNTELIALSKVLLRSGCSERTYDRASRTIGLLGELRCNRTVILYSLASIAAEAGEDIQAEYRRCIDSFRESENPKGKPKRADITASFAAASASNELTMLRVVKSLSTLLKHEATQIAQAKSEDDDERKALVAGNNRFQTSLMIGLQELWKALDTLLELVSEETKQKSQKGVEKVTAIQSAAQALGEDRKRSASKGLSPILARLSHMIEAFLVTHSIEDSDSQTENGSTNESTASPKPSTGSPRASVSPVSFSSPRSQDMEEDAVKSMEEELAVFVERHRGPINALLRANPGLLENSFKGALRHPHAIDFDNKKAYFRNLIRRRSSEAHAGTIRIKVRRDRVFDDSYHQLRMRSPEEMKGRLHVQFTGEEGVDAGGVTREWYVILMRQIFDPNYALFTKSAAKAVTYQPDKRSYINREHLENFHFVGRIIGKAIYDGQLLDAYFTRSFYKHILGLKPTYHDIEAQDPEYYKSLKWMLENDCTGIIDYNMSAEYEEFGKTSVVDLIPNGREIPVTEENKADYVRLVTDIRMTKSIEKQIEAFKRGFHEIIPHDDCKIFNELELELLMSGLPDIDMADMKANVEYTGYTASSPQINWFWRCVSKMDQMDLARLVMFVTGSSKMPLEGFSHLQGMNGIQKLQIHRVAGNTMRLPSAHTCFNQLDLPEYSSAEVLSERLLRAVRDCSVGFGFA